MKLISVAVISVLSFPFIVQFSLSYESVGKTRALWMLIIVCFWTSRGLKIVFIRPIAFKKLQIVAFMSFSPSYN
jgi:hypothetical protein